MTIIKDLFSPLFTWITKERRNWLILSVLILGFASFNIWVFREDISQAFSNEDVVVESIGRSVIVQDKLNEFMYDNGADRVYIFQFHNGLKYYTGEHAQRMSNTYEAVRDGISSEQQNLQNLQVSVFIWFVNEVYKGGLFFSDTGDIADYSTRITLKQQGIKSIAVMPIYKQGKFIGYIGVDYVSSQKDVGSDIQLRDRLETLANSVSEYI